MPPYDSTPMRLIQKFRSAKMANEHDRLASTIFTDQGVARTEPGDPIVILYSFEGADPPVWMEVRLNWVGANYIAVVSNFGIPDRAYALSTHPGLQTKFTSQEQATATEMIRRYFSGPAAAKWAFGRGNCLEVQFAPRWIRLR